MAVQASPSHDAGVRPPAPGSHRFYVPPVSLAERRHDDIHILLWQVRGTSELILDGADHALGVGHAVWLPAGVRHTMRVHANSVLLPMFFDVPDTATTLRTVTTVAVDRDLRTLFLAYIQSQQTIIRPAANLGRQILSLLEGRPAVPAPLPMPTNPAALAVAETLRVNPGDDRSVAELAASVHTSSRTIERAFLAESGTTVRQWRIHSRMAAAGALLRSETSIEAVADRVGYTSVSAFRRTFKGHFGMTPGQYALKYRAQR